jgi:transposase
MSNFRPIDRDTGFLLPPSVDEWLPDKHLARFVVEVIDGLDLSGMCKSYRGTGSACYHPALLLGVLVYGYATGVFSSRKLERATYDSVAFRFIAANDHPDHDTIATFRRRFLPQIEALFVQVLLLAREMGVLKLGTVALDGTKIHANASRHSALSYEHAGKVEAQLKAEAAELLAKAEAADQADIPDGMSIPDELARREDRLRKLADARAKIEARAKERFVREQAEYEAKLAARAAKAAATGKKPGGRVPAPPVDAPLPSDQINLTDEESRIMPPAFAGAGSGRRRFRAALQRAGGGDRGQPAGGGCRCCASTERQAAACAHAGQTRCAARRTWQVGCALGGQRLLQRSERRGLPVSWDQTGDRARARGAPSEPGGALCRGAARTEGPHAARGDGASAADTAGQGALRVT